MFGFGERDFVFSVTVPLPFVGGGFFYVFLAMWFVLFEFFGSWFFLLLWVGIVGVWDGYGFSWHGLV